MCLVTMPVIAPVLPAARPFILLVDDHEPSLRQLCEVVEQSGHRCVAARSATEALIYCDTRRPRVVVTDLSMPGLDGAVLAHWFRARYPGIPLILLTGEDALDPSFRALRTSFDAILTKPLDPEPLLGLLDGLMDEKPAESDDSRP
jgi:CheY-like chemotaxis protein